MEGEPHKPDFPGVPGLFHLIQQVELFHRLPFLFVQGVQEVKVHMVGVQLLQLLVQDAVEIPFRLNQDNRALGGQIHLFPVAIGQGFSHQGFTGPAVVRVSGIHIVDAAVNGVTDQPDGFFFINIGTQRDSVGGGQTHGAKSQGGNFNPGISKFAVIHKLSPFFPVSTTAFLAPSGDGKGLDI